MKQEIPSSENLSQEHLIFGCFLYATLRTVHHTLDASVAKDSVETRSDGVVASSKACSGAHQTDSDNLAVGGARTVVQSVGNRMFIEQM